MKKEVQRREDREGGGQIGNNAGDRWGKTGSVEERCKDRRGEASGDEEQRRGEESRQGMRGSRMRQKPQGSGGEDGAGGSKRRGAKKRV